MFCICGDESRGSEPSGLLLYLSCLNYNLRTHMFCICGDESRGSEPSGLLLYLSCLNYNLRTHVFCICGDESRGSEPSGLLLYLSCLKYNLRTHMFCIWEFFAVNKNRRSGNFRCYNIFVNVRAYENNAQIFFNNELLDHFLTVSTFHTCSQVQPWLY